LLINGASIGAGRWSVTVPICYRSQHSQDTAFRAVDLTIGGDAEASLPTLIEQVKRI
jgi:hypothetical protein